MTFSLHCRLVLFFLNPPLCHSSGKIPPGGFSKTPWPHWIAFQLAKPKSWLKFGKLTNPGCIFSSLPNIGLLPRDKKARPQNERAKRIKKWDKEVSNPPCLLRSFVSGTSDPEYWIATLIEIMLKSLTYNVFTFVRAFHPKRAWSGFGHRGANECSPGDKSLSHYGSDLNL